MHPLIVEFGSGSIRRLPLHKNAGLEIVIIQRGRLKWQADKVKEVVTSGTVYFTLPGQIHGSLDEYEPGHEWMFAVIAARMERGRLRLSPGLPLSRGDSSRVSRMLSESRRHAHNATPALSALFGELLRELQRPGSLHNAQVGLLAAGVVIELSRSIEAGRGLSSRNVVGGAEFRVRRLAERLRQHPEEPWTLSALAAQCGLGRSQFSALLLALTGDSPMRFLNRLRIDLARKKLREATLPITRIAFDCGFESSQYFARVFKEFSGGVSARQYRETTRNERPET